MKVKVNGTQYDVEILSRAAKVNGQLLPLEYEGEEEILLGQTKYRLDFMQEEGEELLMIVNGMAFLVSRHGKQGEAGIKEVRAPIGGQLIDIAAAAGAEVSKGQLLFVLEAMKMENQIRSPTSGRIKFVQVAKGQQVKRGDILLTFE